MQHTSTKKNIKIIKVFWRMWDVMNMERMESFSPIQIEHKIDWSN